MKSFTVGPNPSENKQQSVGAELIGKNIHHHHLQIPWPVLMLMLSVHKLTQLKILINHLTL